MIPKIIHQTWKVKVIPDGWKDAVTSCKRVNNGFKYLLWTHESMDTFVKTYYSGFYKVYKLYKYDIQRCDAFRYLLLYKYGGVYLDLDMICNKELDKFVHYDLVFARSSNVETYFTNAFFMVVPNHPFFKYCIKHLYENKDNYKYFGKHLHVMYSAGPAFLTDMVNNYKNIPNSYTLSKKEYVGDCNACNENICKGGTYFTQVYGKSWNEVDSTVINFALCNKKIISVFFGILFILLLSYYYKMIDKLLFSLI